MEVIEILQWHLEILQWIKEAKEIIKAGLQSDLIVEEKTCYKDLVTNVDKQVEQFIVANIRELYPEDKIMGEEGNGDSIADMSGYVWVIDPIDGTLNFVTKQRDYGIMISLYKDGVGLLGYIYDIEREELLYAIKGHGVYCNDKKIELPHITSVSEGFLHMNGFLLMDASDKLRSLIKKSRGTRTIGASSIEHMNVLTGNSLGYVSKKLAPWDVAAGAVIATELGYVYRTLDNQPIDLLQDYTSLVVCHPVVAKELLAAFEA